MYAKKIEYLKGLMAGLPLDPNTDEHKLFSAVIDALDTMAYALGEAEEDITALEESVDDLEDELDNISEIFEDLHDAAEALEDEDDEDEDGDGEDGGDAEDGPDGEYEITCPGCEHVFVVEEETIFKGTVKCPSCKEKLSFDVGGCGCGKCHDNSCEHDGE